MLHWLLPTWLRRPGALARGARRLAARPAESCGQKRMRC